MTLLALPTAVAVNATAQSLRYFRLLFLKLYAGAGMATCGLGNSVSVVPSLPGVSAATSDSEVAAPASTASSGKEFIACG